MCTPNKILSLFLILWLSSIASFTVLAQTNIKKAEKKTDKRVVLGIQTGKEILLSTPSIHGQTKIHSATTKSIVLKKSLNERFKIETGINYATNTGMDCFCGKRTANLKSSKISLPISLQYYFLPEKYRLHPYCGAGVQGCLSGDNNQLSINNTESTDYNKRQSDTKNITILFTQGFTFEVNTKIQVNQSLHFIPGNTTKVIGIDFGVGYKFP